MSDIGDTPAIDEVRNHRGERLVFVRRPDGAEEALELEAHYLPGDGPPPHHWHPHQDETFEVLEGALRVWIGDDESRVMRRGVRFDVNAGTVHAMGVDGNEACVFRWRVDPALNSEQLFRALWGLNADRPARLGELAGVLRRHRDEFRLARPPRWIQVPVFATLALFERLRGGLERLRGRRGPRSS